MSQQSIEYAGTTYLLIALQILGCLAMLGGIIAFFTGQGPFATPIALSGLIGGATMTAVASVGRVIVDTAEAFQNNLPGIMQNQSVQIKLSEGLVGQLAQPK